MKLLQTPTLQMDPNNREREVIQLAAASRSWVVILASFLGTDPLKYGEHMGQYSYIRIVHLF